MNYQEIGDLPADCFSQDHWHGVSNLDVLWHFPGPFSGPCGLPMTEMTLNDNLRN